MATGISQTYPQQFGRYYLTQKIAMGGMAEIFRAKSIGAEGFEKVVVIKRILPHFCEDEGFVTMFKDEARVAAHLAHANVVQVFDFDEVDDLFYIAMEYVEGHDLKKVLDVGAKHAKPLSIAQAVYVMMEASQGLHYAHTRVVDGQPLNIIHRDVSPHNVMVSYNGEVKIMDFGIAKAASRSTKTRVGTVKGKCAYMSPEQARGKPLDGRSDLFALGVCLWEMLTGKRLFVGESDFETLNNVLKAEVPPASELNPEVPKELDAIVLKSLARDRDARQNDVGQFVSELRRWFYSSVPDPDAVDMRGYMHGLFADDIERMRTDVQAESSLMEGVRKAGTGSNQRKGVTGSSPQAKGGDDERTMALDTGSAGPTTHADSDRTMALPDAMQKLGLAGAGAMAGGSGGRTMVGEMPQPAKSKAGLFVGIGVVAVAVIAIAAFVGISGDPPAPKPVAEVALPKIKVTIKAPGASQISVDDELLCTEAECTYTGKQGDNLKILAKAGDRMKLVRHTLAADGAVVQVDIPAEEKPTEAPKVEAAVASPIVIVQVEPGNATLTVNGAPVTLVQGNAKVPNVKLGDTVKIEAKADGYKTETKDFLVKNAQLETFEIVMQKDKPVPSEHVAAAPAGPGKVSVAAKPWAKVSVKGKDFGLTPVIITLPAGRHTLTFVKGSVTKTAGVTVKSGGTTSASVDMTSE